MASEAQKFAEDYGYQLAFLKSDNELYNIFQKAMKGDWDQTKFVAAVKNSKWYKTHGEAYRTNLSLKTTDPATYNQRVNSQRESIANMAHQMGSPVPGADMARLAEQSILMGWNDDQIRRQIARFTKVGYAGGEAGNVLQQLRSAAYRNGVNVSDKFLQDQLQKVSAGITTIGAVQQQIRSTYGKTLAPGFAKELDSGVDLYDVASPYMQSMAQTLELSPSDIDLFDPTIRKALGSAGDKDGKPGSTPLWQFEQQLRQDPRYMKTQGAQNSVMATGKKVLEDMGLVGG